MALKPVVVAIAFILSCGESFAAPASAPHAATCVAALKAEESALAESLKAGAPVDDELLKIVRSGFAIIGTQYLAGSGGGHVRVAQPRLISGPCRGSRLNRCRRSVWPRATGSSLTQRPSSAASSLPRRNGASSD